MTHPELWRDSRRMIAQVGLFAVCCGLAVWIRLLIAADTLSDLTAVTVQIGGLCVFTCATLVAIATARRARGKAERVALRLVPVGLVLVGAAFVKTNYVDASVALHALLSPEDATQTSVVLGPDGRDIRLSGELGEGAARRVVALLAAHPRIERIHLTSDGGLVDEGEALRKVIATHRLTTFVPDYCVSACTLAFLGGRERLVMVGARLGFHAPFEEGLFGQQFVGDDGTERGLYLGAGVAADFVDEALDVAPADLWTPETDRLIAAHVATGIVGRYRFPDSNLDGSATPSGAREAVLRNFPLAQALDDSRPQSVDAMAAWYLDAYQRGRSEGQVVDGLKTILGGAAAGAMAGADDETLLGLGRFMDAAMRAATSDADCAVLAGRADLLRAETILDSAGPVAAAAAAKPNQDADRLAVALLTHALRTRQDARAGGTEPPVRPTKARLLPAARTCAETRGVYAHLLTLPRQDAAAQIRARVARP